ncbi:holin [Pontibacillus halophilus JSM 076056 = DSM 19796]|uniref:Holin n=1 Tax=Pontibacillus halophilus JSM 076056 = DSM 19796 TaxID=1385510 RepID=A0A0A5GPY6_9BACI|nr:hypothetical protein [Pontibacillus halophilus]KGX93999.1 holin [Pontibacillus halophilus JSM 076056 = DSM 19796]
MTNRWRSYTLWVSIMALVSMLLKDLGVINMVEQFDGYTEAILSILILAGIINNPEKEKPPTEFPKQDEDE